MKVVSGGYAKQVVEGLARLERGVARVAAAHESLVVVGVDEAGHAEVEFLSNTHFDEVGGGLEASSEGHTRCQIIAWGLDPQLPWTVLHRVSGQPASHEANHPRTLRGVEEPDVLVTRRVTLRPEQLHRGVQDLPLGYTPNSSACSGSDSSSSAWFLADVRVDGIRLATPDDVLQLRRAFNGGDGLCEHHV